MTVLHPKHQAKYLARKTAGLCTRCGKVLQGNRIGFVQCASCAELYKDVIKARRQKPQVKERSRELSRERLKNLKGAILLKLGNKCNWPNCTWDDPRVLQIDHIQGGGTKERKEISYRKMYRKVLEDTTGAYQLLCANHNWIKCYEQFERFHGKEPEWRKPSTNSLPRSM